MIRNYKKLFEVNGQLTKFDKLSASNEELFNKKEECDSKIKLLSIWCGSVR